MSFTKAFNELVSSFARFPGVGRRSAERMAFYLLKMPASDAKKLALQIEDINKHLKPCPLCNNFASVDLCSICADQTRNKEIVCIVEEPKDLIAVEKTSHFRGTYFVLLGSISPLEGIGGEDLNLTKLISRLETGVIKEVIIATDPDTDGELTAHYLVEKISPYKIKIFRPAIGIPLGTQIEYVDSATLGKAFLEKRSLI